MLLYVLPRRRLNTIVLQDGNTEKYVLLFLFAHSLRMWISLEQKYSFCLSAFSFVSGELVSTSFV